MTLLIVKLICGVFIQGIIILMIKISKKKADELPNLNENELIKGTSVFS